ncbi:MAG: hypothetical protein DSZ12_04935, partial [Sulfurovum sp.]
MIYYIYTPRDEAFIETVKVYLEDKDIHYLSFDDLDTLDMTKVSHLVVTGCVDEIKLILAIAHQNDVSVGIVPKPEQKELKRTFYLPSKLEDAVTLALTSSNKPLDLLYSNGTIVLQEVVIGDAPPLDQFDSALNGKTYLDRIKIFWRTMKKVKELKHTQIEITNAKENEIKLSAVGMVGVEYNNNTFAAKLIASQLSSNDGKFSIVILSPTSIMQYMGYLFRALVSHLTPTSFPKSVGYIQSSKMYIQTKEPLKVLIDSTLKQQTPVELEVKEKALALSVGEKFWEKQPNEKSTKDTIKVDHLPSDEE